MYLRMYSSEKVKVLVTQLCLTLCNPMDCCIPVSDGRNQKCETAIAFAPT